MKHFSTNRSSMSMFSDFCVAFATADFTTFSISRVALGLFVNFKVISASFTFLPRIRSTTSRAFCGDIRMNLLVALLIIDLPIQLSERLPVLLLRHHQAPKTALRPEQLP